MVEFDYYFAEIKSDNLHPPYGAKQRPVAYGVALLRMRDSVLLMSHWFGYKTPFLPCQHTPQF